MGIYKNKRVMIMRHEDSWEEKGRSGSCRYCGQYIKNGEEFYLVVIMMDEIRKKFPKENNFIVHKDEFDLIAQEFDDEPLAIEYILTGRRPVVVKHTTMS